MAKDFKPTLSGVSQAHLGGKIGDTVYEYRNIRKDITDPVELKKLDDKMGKFIDDCINKIVSNGNKLRELTAKIVRLEEQIEQKEDEKEKIDNEIRDLNIDYNDLCEEDEQLKKQGIDSSYLKHSVEILSHQYNNIIVKEIVGKDITVKNKQKYDEYIDKCSLLLPAHRKNLKI